MTTIQPATAVCPLCSKQSRQFTLSSSSSFGSPDLDTRPPERLRSTLPYWIATCPACGLVAGSGLELGENISPETLGEMQALVTSSAYADAAADMPTLAGQFLRHSLVELALGNHASAAWATLHAAWACDDATCDPAARLCRNLAATRFQRCQAEGHPFAGDRQTETAILADTLRRAGRFEESRAACADCLANGPSPTMEAIVELIMRLCGAGNDAAHPCDEAFDTDG